MKQKVKREKKRVKTRKTKMLVISNVSTVPHFKLHEKKEAN